MKKSKLTYSIVLVVLIVLSILFLFPFIWMILTSLKQNVDATAIPPRLFSENMDFSAYKRLFEVWPFFLYLRNTLILVLYAFAGIILSAMAGYGFAKYNFKHKNLLFVAVLATMMIPSQVNMIPNFVILTKIGLSNTFLAMALPGLVGGFSIFLFRQFMQTIPDEVLEAARIEGLSEAKIFFKVVLPMSKPILSIQAILTFIGSWNSFLWPLIVAQSPDKYTLSLGLSLTQTENGSDVAMMMAGATVMVIPVLIVFFIFQKYILDGYNISGIK